MSSYYDYWEYDIIDFLKRFIESELDESSVTDFLKRFDLGHYGIFVEKKEAKHILLVYGNPEFTLSSKDLSWISSSTEAIVCNFENQNLIFVDLDSSRDSYYINSAAFIKIFNKAFSTNNCYVFKTCNGLAVGSMRRFNSRSTDNFCITQLFQEDSLQIAAEFFDELLIVKYEEIPSIIMGYSPQERFDHVKTHDSTSEYDNVDESYSSEHSSLPTIFATYKEACDVLKYVADVDEGSSFDVLEEVMSVEEVDFSKPDSDATSNESIQYEESEFSAEAYADAEQMLKEMMGTKK